MDSRVEDRLLGRLAGLLEWQGMGTAALTPRPRGGRLHGEDAQEVASLLEQLTEADAGLPAGAEAAQPDFRQRVFRDREVRRGAGGVRGFGSRASG